MGDLESQDVTQSSENEVSWKHPANVYLSFFGGRSPIPSLEPSPFGGSESGAPSSATNVYEDPPAPISGFDSSFESGSHSNHTLGSAYPHQE